MRKETDQLGTVQLEDGVLWGVHTERARTNFHLSKRPVPYELISAIATVKQAAAKTNAELGFLPADVAGAIDAACSKIASGEARYRALFPLDALQGGAGTSTNMNVNEVIANLALAELGLPAGDYKTVHPIEHVNLHQSTNDVYPTSLRIAAIGGLRTLSDALAGLQGAFQRKESEFQGIVKMGRTEMQPAVPMTLGQEFSSFAEAAARDRWRCFKCEERLRLVNIGGTAIGTGLTAPRQYIFRVIEVLRSLTGMGLSRGENTVDATANADAFVEVSGILKAVATNLSKMAHDLRLLHSLGEIRLPAVQAGSSIMPGKVNPVIAESVIQASLVVRANDYLVAECGAHGTLQINEFMPLIASALLESIDVLKESALTLAAHVDGIAANPEQCRALLADSPTLITALLPLIGYDRACNLIEEYEAHRKDGGGQNLKDFLRDRLGAERVEEALSATSFLRLGQPAQKTGDAE